MMPTVTLNRMTYEECEAASQRILSHLKQCNVRERCNEMLQSLYQLAVRMHKLSGN